MNLFTTLNTKYMKPDMEAVVHWIGDDPERFEELMRLYLHHEDKVLQRAAWVMDMLSEKHPEVVAKHIDAILHRIGQMHLHDAVRRHGANVLLSIDMPERIHGDVMNLFFDLLADVKQPVAVRCLAMDILVRLTHTYPDLKPELVSLIENEVDASAAFRATSKRAMNTLKKIKG